jgi:hypothetical protein
MTGEIQRVSRRGLLWLAAARVTAVMGLLIATSCRPSSDVRTEEHLIRATERERLRALVEADIDRARPLHADEFQLINPFGGASTKEQYLGSVATGETDYRLWEPDLIDVRLYGLGAVIRYRSRLQVVFRGQDMGVRHHWHTDAYEKRNGRWQVVWSQATIIVN